MTGGDLLAGVPTGTVTFLLTDVEGSTRLWEEAPDGAGAAIAQQSKLIAEAVTSHGGVRPEEQGEGDSSVAAFASATAAAAAALDIQRAMARHAWPGASGVRVRIGLHTGEAVLRDARNYTGIALHRCARIRDVAHGGQTVMSEITASLLADALPTGAWLVDLGPHRLRDLARPDRLYELRHSDVPGEFPPLRSLDAVPNNLPVPVTSFRGRESDLLEVDRLLAASRLVTLTGSGGCGKTRLAAQVAAAAADRYPEGVWWVDLTSTTAGELTDVVASTVGVLVDPALGSTRALVQQFRHRQLLLCLDNCEHVLDATVDLVGALLPACAGVTVLATSREALAAPGETALRVRSLSEADSIDLFADRAAAARPGFVVGAHNRETLERICKRLDGIPLGIELAAAWVRTLAPTQIADGLDDRFRLLVGGQRGVVARQQTLLASIDWSHDLLTDIERALFRRLAVFVGGWSLEAALAVCTDELVPADDLLTTLGRLVDKSLVIVDEGGGVSRYSFLETIRQYAQDRLHDAGEMAVTRDRHLAHFVELAEAAEPELERIHQDEWSARLEVEHDNLRSAIEWGLSARDSDHARRLTAALGVLWWSHGPPRAALGWLEEAIALDTGDTPLLQTRLLFGSAAVAILAGDFPLALQRGDDALAQAKQLGNDGYAARALIPAYFVRLYFDLQAAGEIAEQARQLAIGAGDELAVAFASGIVGFSHFNRDRYDDARRAFEDLDGHLRRRGDRMSGSFARLGLGGIALHTGDVREAERLFRAGLEIAEPLKDYFAVGQMRAWLALAVAMAGDLDRPIELLEPLTGAGSDTDHHAELPMLPITLAQISLWAGDLDQARRWGERALTFAAPLVDNMITCWVLPTLATACHRAGDHTAARDHAARGVELASRIGMPRVEAAALDALARLDAGTDPRKAEDLHHRALAIRVDHGLRTFYVESFEALAELASRTGSHHEAARLLGAADAGRETVGYRRPPGEEADHDRTLADLRASLGEDAARAAMEEGASLSLDEAVSYARRARGTRGRPSTGWEALTPTEHDIVHHVVDGLTNPEIGRKLLMSRDTVKTHLRHIYAKLGIVNRSELVRVAARREP